MDTKAYWILKNSNKEGAFTFEELIKHEIYDTTLIWKNGWDDWKEAKDVAELQGLIAITPPLTPIEKKQVRKKQQMQSVTTYLRTNLGMIIMVALCLTIIVNVVMYFGIINAASISGNMTEEERAIRNLYPVYLTNAERANPSIIFFKLLPYSLLIGAAIAFIGSGLRAIMKSGGFNSLTNQT